MITWTPGKKLYQLEREVYKEANTRYGGSKKKLAEGLGVSTATVYRKCRQFGLMPKKRGGK